MEQQVYIFNKLRVTGFLSRSWRKKSVLYPNNKGSNQPAHNQPQDERYRSHVNVTKAQNPQAWGFGTSFPGCSGGRRVDNKISESQGHMRSNACTLVRNSTRV